MLAYTDRQRNEKMKGRNSVKDSWEPRKGKEREEKKLIDIKIRRKE
jgi:hypothetical protein